MPEVPEVFASKFSTTDWESLRGRLTAATCRLSQHLATQRRACLTQIWVPDAAQDGSATLHTQVRRVSPCQRRILCLAHLGTGLYLDHSLDHVAEP